MPGGCWLRRLRSLRWWFFFAGFDRATAAGSYLSSLRCEAEGWKPISVGEGCSWLILCFRVLEGIAFVFENYST